MSIEKKQKFSQKFAKSHLKIDSGKKYFKNNRIKIYDNFIYSQNNLIFSQSERKLVILK